MGKEVPDKLEILYKQNADALQNFQQSEWAVSLVHHDLNPGNLIATETGLVLIDWEYAAPGYAGMDSSRWLMNNDPCAGVVQAYIQLIDGYWQLLASDIQ